MSEAYNHFKTGRDLLNKNQPAQASVALAKARRLAPGEVSICEALGRAYYNFGAYEKAREVFSEAVELAPTNNYVHFGLGKSLEKLGEKRLARRHFKLAEVFGLPNSLRG